MEILSKGKLIVDIAILNIKQNRLEAKNVLKRKMVISQCLTFQLTRGRV